MCIVTLSSDDGAIGQDYYVKATFQPGNPFSSYGPNAGFTFNMDETSENGNYVMMR